MSGELLTWLLSADLSREKLTLLVWCTALVYVLAAQLRWRLLYAGAGRGLVRSMGRSWVGQWSAQGGRLLYYVGIPGVILWRQKLFPAMGIPTTWSGSKGSFIWHMLGLDEPGNLMRICTAVTMWGGGVCLLAFVWVWHVRTTPEVKFASAVAWWQTWREGLFLQALWAFYRGVISMWTGNPVYVAFLAWGLVALSWSLDPLRRHHLHDASQGYRIVRDWMLALFTAFVAMTVHSLGVLVLMHTGWLWASDRILHSLAQKYAPRSHQEAALR